MNCGHTAGEHAAIISALLARHPEAQPDPAEAQAVAEARLEMEKL
jgi:hypothetical protein